MKEEYFKLYNPSKKVKSFISTIFNRKYENGHYYAIGEYNNGEIQISENNSIETMRFAQNWTSKKENVVYE